MNRKIKTTLEQRNKLLDLIIINEVESSNSVAKFLGFEGGITAEFFEYVIAQDGLHIKVIQAIAVCYKDDIKVVINNAEVRGAQ